MPCYCPITGFRSEFPNENNKFPLVFRRQDVRDHNPEMVTVPCGKCVGCLIDKQKSWAVRIVHEAQLYDENCFVTLTYENQFLPKDLSLDVSHFQKFMKKLRKRFKGLSPVINDVTGKVSYPIRYFMCGEYGEQFNRPHYHICLFNFNFSDLREEYMDGKKVYMSDELDSLWKKGYATVDEINFNVARYVAKYCVKKFDDDPIPGRSSEFATMSRRPGLGAGWYQLYKSDVFPCDSVVIGGQVVGKPPTYYDRLLEKEDPFEYERIKEERRLRAEKDPENKSERLACRGHAVKKRVDFFRKNKGGKL